MNPGATLNKQLEKTFMGILSKNKKSKKVKPGTTIQTRDEFLEGGEDTKKDHPNKNDLYRTAATMFCNEDGDLIITKLSTKGRHSLNNYKSGKSKYNAYFVSKDNNGKRIRIDKIRFVENNSNRDLSKKEIKKILYDCLYNPKTSKNLREENRAKLEEIKGNKKSSSKSGT